MSQTFKCNECGCVFDADNSGRIKEYYGEGSMRGAVNWIVCPECGSDNFDEAKKCCCCGLYFSKENEMVIAGDEWICRECAEEVAESFLDAWGMTESMQNAMDCHEARMRRIKSIFGGKNNV